VWRDVKARLDEAGTTTIPVSVEAAEPGDVVLDATDTEPVADADVAANEATPHETPASSPGAP
jgi:hypothetical protein